MTVATKKTLFADAERSSTEEIGQLHDELATYETVSRVLNAMPQFVALLDENRQIVAANSSLIDSLGSGNIETILGSRPGEMLDCQHATEMPGGCGCSESCRMCGAVNAILTAQQGTADTRDCQITQGESLEALDLQITATPVRIGERDLTTISIRDVADQKRRLILERTFFHDVLNAAGGAWGLANVLNEAEDMTEVREFAPLLVQVTEQLIAEVEAQRDFIAAEEGRLAVASEDIDTADLLHEVQHTYTRHPVAEGRTIRIDPQSQDIRLQSSRTLLLRVIGNMTKNALEASPEGSTVTLGCTATASECHFRVNNPGLIPRDARLQIFNRSFSTKGPGRGIGTYSIKLLGEKYLGGVVSFVSDEDAGTTFGLRLPRPIQAP